MKIQCKPRLKVFMLAGISFPERPRLFSLWVRAELRHVRWMNIWLAYKKIKYD